MITNPTRPLAVRLPAIDPSVIELGLDAYLREMAGLPFEQSLRLAAVMTDERVAHVLRFSAAAAFLLAELCSEDETEPTSEYIRRRLLQTTVAVVRLEKEGEHFLNSEIEDDADSAGEENPSDSLAESESDFISALRRDPLVLTSVWHEPMQTVSPSRRQLMTYLRYFMFLENDDIAKPLRCTINVVYQNICRAKAQLRSVALELEVFRHAAATWRREQERKGHRA